MERWPESTETFAQNVKQSLAAVAVFQSDHNVIGEQRRSFSPLRCRALFHESEYGRGLHLVATADVARCELLLAAPGAMAEAPAELRRLGEFSGQPVRMRPLAFHDYDQAIIAEGSRPDRLENLRCLAPDGHRRYFVCMACT